MTYNSADDLEACLDSIAAQTHRELEVIVVDNASSDGSLEVARHVLPSCRTVANPCNVGFARGQNTGIDATEGEFFMSLNPDVRLQPTFLEQLVAAIRDDPAIGTATGKLLLAASGTDAGQPRIDSTGLFISRSRRQLLRGHGELDTGQFDRDRDVFGACGAAPLFRRAMLEDVRVAGECFDSDFFMHKEDVDLAWRARLFGWRAVFAPGAVAYHRRTFRPGIRRGIQDDVRAHAVKNRYLTIVKNDHFVDFVLDAPWIIAYDVGILTYLLLRERSSLAGIAQFFRLLPAAVRKRREIQRRRRTRGRSLRPMLR